MSSKNNQTVSQKIEKLREMVEWFESDDFVLDEAIERYKNAEKLAGEIEEDLANLRNEINVLKRKFE